MKQIKKITVGFVVQTWDAESGKFLGQEFVAGDQVDYEDENGEVIDKGEKFFEKYPYHCFDMVQDPPTGFTFMQEEDSIPHTCL